MRSKIFLLSVGVLFLMFLLLNVGFGSAASCSVTDRVSCTGSSKVVLKLSSSNNAHGALTSQVNFPEDKVVCCDFGGGGTSCTGTNKFLGLSTAGNAHGETPKTLTGYTTLSYTTNNACYSVKDCRATTDNCVTSGPQSGREVEMIRLSSLGNSHLGNSASGYGNKVCCKLSEEINNIIVTSPNLGTEDWQIDSQQTITWDYTGTISNVNIEISRDNGLTWDTPLLFESTTNDGSESWTVTGPTTIQALIRISDAADANTKDVSDAVFTISSSGGGGGDVPPLGECTTSEDCQAGSVCANGFCQAEDTVNENCDISDAYWERNGVEISSAAATDFVEAGDSVNLVAIGGSSTECDGNLALFKINRKLLDSSDLPGYDIPPLFGLFSGTKATTSWSSVYNQAISVEGYQKYNLDAIHGTSAKNSETEGNDLLKVIINLENILDIVPDWVPKCLGYSDFNEEVCNDDPLGVSSGDCTPGIDCMCAWNPTSGECETVGLGGFCVYSSAPAPDSGSCDDGDQFIKVEITGTWNGEEGHPDEITCENTVTKTLECPAQIALPFFGGYGILITIVLIVGIYWVMNPGHRGRDGRDNS